MRKLTLILGALSLVSSVLAEGIATKESFSSLRVPAERKPYGADKLGIGVGVVGAEKLYKQKDKNIALYPNLDIQYGNFYVEGIRAGLYLYESDMLAFSVFVDPMEGASVKGKDMKKGYKNISDRDTMVMGGGKLELRQLPGDIQVAASLKGGEHGQQADLVAMRRFPVTSKFSIIPSINGAVTSSDYTDYYFGVSKKEVDRSSTDKLDKTYNGDRAYIYGANLALEYAFNENLQIIASTGISHFNSAIGDSPIVANKTIFYNTLGAKYMF